MGNSNFIKKLHGPIGVFGAGGFIGINLLNTLLKARPDVIGFSQNPSSSWRIRQNNIPQTNISTCNLLDVRQVTSSIKKYQPKTIFNLSAYGAYSKQTDIEKIYQTNFHSTISLIEAVKKYTLYMYIHAGSQSEYGLNATAPKENDTLLPNSHYAVSKTAVSYLIKYYGVMEKLPVVHLRLYSVYGPWEEPDRLIPVLIAKARSGELPSFVDPAISRDFIYVDDVIDAFVRVAVNLTQKHYGTVFNVATGKKTTIRQLAYLVKKLFSIDQKPVFGTMKKRGWDLHDWVGDPSRIQKEIGWTATTSLENGLKKTYSFKP